ncbi:MAG: hypothetical protein KAV44_06600 [Bacteroidales bacterium]|nr:hypothetical protein [Bacteroidales bacterium]
MITNKNRNVLYMDVTNSLGRRIYEHEKVLIEGFAKKYNYHCLILYVLFNIFL